MTPLIPMDIHSHSEYSMDANYPIATMCESALKKGVGVFAVTDHYDIKKGATDFSRLDASIRNSLKDTLAAKGRFRDDMLIFTGIELGQALDNPAKAEEILSSHDFDYVIGALHNAPDRIDLFHYDPVSNPVDLEDELERYFSNLLALVRWGRFDSVAHISYPFRYILSFHPDFPAGKWDSHLEAIVREIAAKGLAMELNTSGVNRPTPPRFMPEARWVKRFRELGGEKLTLGADSHVPSTVAAGIIEGTRIALDAGFSRICYFKNRKAQFIELESIR